MKKIIVTLATVLVVTFASPSFAVCNLACGQKKASIAAAYKADAPARAAAFAAQQIKNAQIAAANLAASIAASLLPSAPCIPDPLYIDGVYHSGCEPI